MENKELNVFSDEELDRMSGSLFTEEPVEGKRDEKVTVLGMTFDSDEFRRAFFREELKKKLPELRKMEGFPFGTDDDIVNLSDPPFFTACPNPWLNDIIREWETEKKKLERQGVRKSIFEVCEPYSSDVSEGKNNPIYLAHSYYTKVPHPAIMRYILHYTQPGDIVFDGFAGTGMTGVAAQMCGSADDVKSLNEKDAKVGVRHAVCSDLSPIASLIAATYNLKFDPEVFKKKANDILNQAEKEFGWMYETEVDGKKAKIHNTVWSDVFICPSCGGEIILWKELVDLENKEMKDSFRCPHCGAKCTKKSMDLLFETIFDKELGETISMNKSVPVRISCSIGKRRYEKDVDEKDIELIEKTKNLELKQYIPIALLPEGEKTKDPQRTQHIDYIHQFYTRRNLIYLSRVFELAGNDIFLKTLVTSVLYITTKMNAFRFFGTGITKGTLYIPSLSREFTPYYTIMRKVKSFTDTFYRCRGNSLVGTSSATSLHNVASSSIDYIFTDPPFGANIMYSELNYIWESWLRVHTNNKEEAIVNKVQRKTLFEYQNLMNRSFKEYYRVLKPGKWFTVEFSNTSASVWNSIQNALQGVGFVVANVAALDKQQGSFNAVNTTTAVKQDLVITCYKPTNELLLMFEESADKSKNAMDFIEELLCHLPIHIEKDKSTTTIIERSPKILYDRLIAYYVQHGYPIPMDAQEFQRELARRFVERDGMFFTATQAIEYEEKKKTTIGVVPLGIFVNNEADGIAWLKNRLQTKQLTYQEIQPMWLQAIQGVRKYDILPELKDLLEENFIEENDGKWRLPNIQDDVDKEALRTKALLREYKVYVEASKKPRARIKEVRVEALRAGFKQCYADKDFATIVSVCDHIPPSLRDEDEVLLQYYDIALTKID